MRRRAKLTLAEKRKRAARNERRGREPRGGVVAVQEPEAQFYRYDDFAVRVFRGRCEVVREYRPDLVATVPMLAPKGFAKLPRKLRRQIAEEAADLSRRERMGDMGIEVPERSGPGRVELPDTKGAWSEATVLA